MKSPQNARVRSTEELGTMSKNNLRGITLGIIPIWWIHSFTLHPLLYLYNGLEQEMESEKANTRKQGISR